MKTLGTKNIFIAFIIASMAVSCTLEENLSDAKLDPSALNSPEALEAAVAGMYRQFEEANKNSQSFIRAYGGDDVTTHSGLNKQGFRDSDQMKMTSLTAGVEWSYTPAYAVIKEANNIITNEGSFSTSSNESVNAM